MILCTHSLAERINSEHDIVVLFPTNSFSIGDLECRYLQAEAFRQQGCKGDFTLILLFYLHIFEQNKNSGANLQNTKYNKSPYMSHVARIEGRTFNDGQG